MYDINVGKNIQLCNDLVCISAMYAGIFMHGHLYIYIVLLYIVILYFFAASVCV
jgi:hypothetical protein